MEKSVGLVGIVIGLVVIIGWIANLITVIPALRDEVANYTGFVILQIIGIFVAPLGVILGWISMF